MRAYWVRATLIGQACNIATNISSRKKIGIKTKAINKFDITLQFGHLFIFSVYYLVIWWEYTEII